MLNWFSSLELNWVESVACALLGSAAVCSTMILLCMLVGNFVRSIVIRYWLVFAGQLSCLVFFVAGLMLFYSGSLGDASMKGEIVLNEVVIEDANFVESDAAAVVADTGVNAASERVEQAPLELVVVKKSREIALGVKVAERSNTWETSMTKVLEYSNMIVWVWILGVVVMFLRWSLGAYGLVQLRRSGREASEELTTMFSDLKEAHPKVRARLRESASIVTPMVVGWMKPVVYVPCGLMMRMAPDQVEALLLHELAHMRRYDYFWNLLQRLSEVLFFFNPMMWWAGKVVRQLREEICDESVVAKTHEPKRYAEALYALEESRGEWLAVAATGSSLKRRFEVLLGKRKSRLSPLSSFSELAVLAVLGAACFLPMAAEAEGDVLPNGVPDKMFCEPLYGRVVDVDGKPVSGAKVMLYYGKKQPFDPRSKVVEEVVSGEDGVYKFKSRRVYSDQGWKKKWTDHYAVIVKHPDWAIGWRDVVSPDILEKKAPESKDLVVKLERPVKQSFTVKMVGGEKGDYTPLEGAKIHLAYLFPAKNDANKRGLYLGADFGLSSGVTDKDGKVTLSGLPASKCSFVINHKDTGRSWKTRKYKQKNDWHTRCYPAAGVSGRLVSSDGEALADVLLEIRTGDRYDSWFVRTDSEGRYSVSDLYGKGQNASAPMGKGKAEFVVKVISDVWFAEYFKFKLEPKEFKKLHDFKVFKGVPVKVYTKNSQTGEALPFARVWCRNGASDPRRYSDAQGVARFNVLPGNRIFYMEAPQGLYFDNRDSETEKDRRAADVYVLGNENKQSVKLSATVKPTRSIEGKIISPDGSDVFAGEIQLQSVVRNRGSYGFSAYHHKARLGQEEGNARRFHVDDVALDLDYLVYAQDAKSGLVGIGELEPDSKKIVIRLERAVSQRVRLKNGKGEPLRNQEIHYKEYDRKRDTEVWHVGKIKTNDQGEATLTLLRKEAEYLIHLSDDVESKRAVLSLDLGKTVKLQMSGWDRLKMFDEKGNDIEVEKVVSVSVKSKNGKEVFIHTNFLSYIQKNEDGSWTVLKRLFKSYVNERNQSLAVVAQLKSGGLVSMLGNFTEDRRIDKLQVVSRTALKLDRINSIEGVEPKTKNSETLSGMIVDEDGNPVQGAKLAVNESDAPQLSSDIKISSTDKRSTTNEKGEFTVARGMNYPTNCLRIDAEGYATRWIPSKMLADGAKRITMQKRSRCEGVIRNKFGKPMANEVLYFVTERTMLTDDPYHYNGAISLKPLRVSLRTDDQGKFSQLLEPGKWRLIGTVTKDFVVDEVFELNLGQKFTIAPQLKPAVEFTVIIKDEETLLPVRGAVLRLNHKLGPYFSEDISASTEREDGKLVFKGLLPGQYTLTYEKGLTSEDISTNRYVSARVGGEESEDGVLELDLRSGLKVVEALLTPGRLVKAKVSSDIITDFQDVSVAVMRFYGGSLPKRGSKRLTKVGVARCNKNGNFSCYFPLVDGATYQLIAYEKKNSGLRSVAPEMSEYFVATEGKVKEISLEMKRGGIIKGRVVDQEGKPVVQALVRHNQESKEQSGLVWTRTDEKGYFVLKGVSPGFVWVEAVLKGRGNQGFRDVNYNPWSKNVKVDEGQEVDIDDLVLPKK
ncbi:MAG: beta-lactamase regulating signal transducer with metallopeptidase domain [Rubritalea sp.]|jgi:beta-lactamase regulating signal transducer with metallopeptidase domain/protocatechuate 3,4-dioxygenase beta subunit